MIILVIRILSLGFALALTVVSVNSAMRRYKHRKDTFFDAMAFLTGLSMTFHYGWALYTAGGVPIDGEILMAMRTGTLFALFTLFGLLYRRMLVEK